MPLEGYDPTESFDLATNPKTHIAERLGISVSRLNNLIESDGPFADVGNIAAEIEVLSRLRALSMVSLALDTLESIMTGDVEDTKRLNAMTRAADSLLDRTILPKRVRAAETHQPPLAETGLPSLSELLKGAKTPDEFGRIVQAHRDVMDRIDALRVGAKNVIELSPQVKE